MTEPDSERADLRGIAWLSASEAAARLGVPVRTLLERARAGDFPCDVGLTGAPVFRAADVDAARA